MNPIEVFFRLLFGPKASGYMCIATLNPDNKKDMVTRWFSYPKEINQAAQLAESYGETHNVYFCPQLFSKQERHKEFVNYTPNIWADLDTCGPEKLLVEPSVLVESSPGRYQAFWIMDDYEIPPLDIEAMSRRIAYHHASDGCDKTGWDLTQLLRVPNTRNLKYTDRREIPIVTIKYAKKAYYRLRDFKEYPELVDYTYTDIPMPTGLTQKDAEDILATHKKSLPYSIWKLFTTKPELHSYSDALWNLELALFESGFGREDVFTIVRQSACNKYARDGRPDSHLWKEVCRAEVQFKLSKHILVKKPEAVLSLMSAEERQLVNGLEQTFIERYIDWASGLGDAAKQYHQAGAFIILSALLCGSVKLPTSYDVIIPNLWFMVLGDTTLTRKTTSMNIAMSLLDEVDKDLVMATDGSVEGLFTNLSIRPGKPSIFLRDEFSGLIASMLKKDYMADLPEMLTKMYDGKMQKRILRKEIIEITDPRLLIYAGGIKSKVMSLLTAEHVSSGFIPRFIFITAESDITKLKPLGPPTEMDNEERGKILAEMKKLHRHYSGNKTIKIEGVDEVLNTQKEFNAKLTDEAWIRYNQLETELVQLGMQSHNSELLTPVGDRLSKSILKAAVLIAASRQFNSGTDVVVSNTDILRAIKFGEMWRTYATEIIDGIDTSSLERIIEGIYKMLLRRGDNGATRSAIMRTYKLTSRDANSIFSTMEDRNMIDVTRSGQTVTYFAKDFQHAG